MEITIYVDGNGTVTFDYPAWMDEDEALERVYASLDQKR